MKLSARNQFKGKVVSIEKGAVNAIVGIEIAGGNVVTATISMGSVERLGLVIGKEAYAVIKATSVMVGVDDLATLGVQEMHIMKKPLSGFLDSGFFVRSGGGQTALRSFGVSCEMRRMRSKGMPSNA